MQKMLKDCGVMSTEFFMSHKLRDSKEIEKKEVPSTAMSLQWELNLGVH